MGPKVLAVGSKARPAGLVLFAAMSLVALSGGVAMASPIPVTTFTPKLKLVGTVNLSELASPNSATSPSTTAGDMGAASGTSFRAVDNQVIQYGTKARANGALMPSATTPSTTVSDENVPGESGFVGITGYDQALANGNLDLEPPDQGLCAGGGYVGEFINNAFSVYQPDGAHLLPVIPSYELFKQPSSDFFSDPRCHYDAATQRWFLQEFIVGSGNSPSLEFIAVSNTSDPTGTYTVWSINTTDKNTAGCPCFGDYDEFGADANGIYITTDEFSSAGSAYNGVIIYAISKELLETYANTGIPPVPVAYRLTSDAFGQPYIVSPTSTPPGAAFAPDTEYFVESNGNAFSDDHLIVYALRDTSLLAQPGVPPMYRTEVASEGYSFPPDATQEAGPIPLGKSVGDPEGQIQADFDSVMQTTYTGGHVYAELDSGTSSGTDEAAWFILTPHAGNALTATVANQGYVDVPGENLIYPAIGVDSAGDGYMTFALSGPDYFPSAAYTAFGPTGAAGPVRIAQPGADPEDGFTCYAAFVGPNYGGCRWGDYSAAVAVGRTIYMGTEMIPPTSRDYLTNWGTYLWSAPAP